MPRQEVEFEFPDPDKEGGTEDELQELFDQGEKIGPWFRLIKENFLNDIWNTLDDLSKAADGKLHKMDECQ